VAAARRRAGHQTTANERRTPWARSTARGAAPARTHEQDGKNGSVTCSYDGVFKLVTIEFGAHDDDEVELVAEAFAVEPRVIAAA
jgi:hypothetical protein